MWAKFLLVSVDLFLLCSSEQRSIHIQLPQKHSQSKLIFWLIYDLINKIWKRFSMTHETKISELLHAPSIAQKLMFFCIICAFIFETIKASKFPFQLVHGSITFVRFRFTFTADWIRRMDWIIRMETFQFRKQTREAFKRDVCRRLNLIYINTRLEFESASCNYLVIVSDDFKLIQKRSH